jgi:hypothetical protein
MLPRIGRILIHSYFHMEFREEVRRSLRVFEAGHVLSPCYQYSSDVECIYSRSFHLLRLYPSSLRISNMHIIQVIVSTTLAFATTSHAWAQAENGVWVAHNQSHRIGGTKNSVVQEKGRQSDCFSLDMTVHEACTRMGTQDWWSNGEDCAFWSNSHGGITHGRMSLYAACTRYSWPQY